LIQLLGPITLTRYHGSEASIRVMKLPFSSVSTTSVYLVSALSLPISLDFLINKPSAPHKRPQQRGLDVYRGQHGHAYGHTKQHIMWRRCLPIPPSPCLLRVFTAQHTTHHSSRLSQIIPPRLRLWAIVSEVNCGVYAHGVSASVHACVAEHAHPVGVRLGERGGENTQNLRALPDDQRQLGHVPTWLVHVPELL
jgi:hypothetical protein